jgi:glycosyltransferase involved in cell wall biosynthesis
VAHITLGLEMGGQEKLLVEFARHADRAQFALHFVSLTTRGSLARDIEAAGWPVTALEMPSGLRLRLMLRLASFFRRWQIDVVHTHDERPHIHGVVAARVARVPRVIHTRHGQALRLTRRQTALVNLAAGLTDRFVCVSEDCARRTVEHGVSRRKVCTLWNGIDLTRFLYAGPSRDGPIVTVARLSPEKDVATLLRAAANPDAAGLHVEIAGAGPCLPELQRLAQELGVGERVRFLGEVRDVAALLARASVFVLPSASEGISLTLLEAMARGLPVVATRVGGNPEVVREGETGLLVPPHDPPALAAALLRVRQDPEWGERLGKAGRRRVEQCFDVRRMVAAYEVLYQGHDPEPVATGTSERRTHAPRSHLPALSATSGARSD